MILPSTEDFLLNKVKPRVTVGLVGGSDLSKIAEQMGGHDGSIGFLNNNCSVLTNFPA